MENTTNEQPGQVLNCRTVETDFQDDILIFTANSLLVISQQKEVIAFLEGQLLETDRALTRRRNEVDAIIEDMKKKVDQISVIQARLKDCVEEKIKLRNQIITLNKKITKLTARRRADGRRTKSKK